MYNLNICLGLYDWMDYYALNFVYFLFFFVLPYFSSFYCIYNDIYAHRATLNHGLLFVMLCVRIYTTL
jgi:hypothetical protein